MANPGMGKGWQLFIGRGLRCGSDLAQRHLGKARCQGELGGPAGDNASITDNKGIIGASLFSLLGSGFTDSPGGNRIKWYEKSA